jgi:hypothetical protein
MLIEMDEINRLNVNIKMSEEHILLRRETEIRLRKTKELVLLQMTYDLEQKYNESKDKKLSTIEKRHIEAEKSLELQKLIKEFELYKHTTDVMEIELSFNKRLFDIMLKFGEKK